MRINTALKERENSYLDRLFNPAGTLAGLKCVITPDEDALIKESMKRFACKAFAIDLLTLGSMMASVATDERKGFKSGLPFAAIIISFCARNRYVTVCKSGKRERKAERRELRAHSDLFTCRKTNNLFANIAVVSFST